MIINNVKLVLDDDVVHGSLEVQDGRILAFAESQSRLPQALDGEGGWLLPGLIELHTDNLDKFFTPRPKVDWPAHSAMSSHDAMMVASGITTVLDAVAIGDVRDGGDRLENLEKMVNAVEETQKRGLNRAEHRLHLRCELPHHTTLPLFEKLIDRESVSMVSLMDHSPGQRQYADRSKYRDYYQGKYHLTHDEMDRFEAEQMALAATWSQPNRQTIAAMCRARRIALASHDDATEAHVAESHQLGSVIAEFPTTLAAAQASRQHGMHVLMGAPNIVRGGSHSGNVAAHLLANHGLLDILSSDYYPASLLDAAFRIADAEDNAFTLRRRSVWSANIRRRRWALTIAASSPRGNAPTWCWRTVAASMSTSTMSGAREGGSFNAGKTDLAGGPLRLRERQPAGGAAPARAPAAAGGASLHYPAL